MKLFTRNRLSKILQGQKNRNHKAFSALCDIGFTPPQARRMLIAGNNIRVKHLAQGAKVTAPTIYAAAYGKRQNPDGQAILADALGIPVKALFPDGGAVSG